MLLRLTNSAAPATDLGFLLHKNPANLHSVGLTFGLAHVFHAEAAADRCTACLQFPEWADSRYVRLNLAAEVSVHDALSHPYVLLQVVELESLAFGSTVFPSSQPPSPNVLRVERREAARNLW